MGHGAEPAQVSLRETRAYLRRHVGSEIFANCSVDADPVSIHSSNPAAVKEHIQAFITTYAIDTKDLLKPDPASYACFNEFFARKLKPDARPIAQPENDKVISSSADCRLTVFDSVEEAKEIWVKGQKFTIGSLIADEKLADNVFTPGSDIVIFRLAPADYHRFHWPVGPSIAGPTKSVEGEYFTVNVSLRTPLETGSEDTDAGRSSSLKQSIRTSTYSRPIAAM